MCGVGMKYIVPVNGAPVSVAIPLLAVLVKKRNLGGGITASAVGMDYYLVGSLLLAWSSYSHNVLYYGYKGNHNI